MKIALLGYGKMGKAIESVIDEKNRVAGKPVHKVILKIDEHNSSALSLDALAEADVAISIQYTAYSVSKYSEVL